MRLVKFILGYSKKIVVMAMLAGLVSGASNTALLAVINAALTRQDANRQHLLWAFIALCIAVPVTRVASELMLTHLGQRTIYDLRLQMSRQILTVPLPHLEKLGVAKLMATLTDDIPAITGVLTTLPILCINFSILVGCLVYMGWLSWQVLLAVIFFIVIGIVGYQLPVAKATKHFRRAWRERDEMYSHFRALTEGTKELKLHHHRRVDFIDNLLSSTADNYRSANLIAQRIYTIASSWGQLLVFVVIGLVLFAVDSLPIDNTGAETLTGFTLVLLYIMTPLQVLMNSTPGLSRAAIALGRVDEMGIDLAEHASDAETREPAEMIPWQSLRLVGVTHTYRGEGEEKDFRLGPIDFEISPGELVFIAGGNGSGKTTLSKMLVGLYPVEEGEILLDEKPINAENLEWYRQYFTVLFSDFYLFKQLLGLGSDNLDEKAGQYLERLQIDHKVEIKGGKLSTTDLSQGQRKRLALLTAYLEDRPIYVFDEWAADQDPVFRDIFYLQILPELKKRGKAVVVISHDDRYYHIGDRLITLDYGRIVDNPSYASAAGYGSRGSKDARTPA